MSRRCNLHTNQLISTAKAFRDAFNVYKNKGQLNQKLFNKLSYDSALAIVNTFLNKASDFLKTNPNDVKYKQFVNYLYGEETNIPNDLLDTIIKWYFKETSNKKPFDFTISKDNISIKSVDKMRRYFSTQMENDIVETFAKQFEWTLDLIKEDLIGKTNDKVLANKIVNYTNEQLIKMFGVKGVFNEMINYFLNEDENIEETKDILGITNDKLAQTINTNRVNIARILNQEENKDILDQLCERATKLINVTENKLSYDNNNIITELSEITENDLQETNEALDKEDDIEDRTRESITTSEALGKYDTLKLTSLKVRNAIRNLDYIDSKGNTHLNNLGILQKVPEKQAWGTLLDNLSDVDTSEEMMDKLQRLEVSVPYLSNIVRLAEEDDGFRAELFTQAANKTFVNMKTIDINNNSIRSLNTSPKIATQLDIWRSDISKRVLGDTKQSIYTLDGRFNTNLPKDWTDKDGNKISQRNITVEQTIEILNHIGIEVDGFDVVKLQDIKLRQQIAKQVFAIKDHLNKDSIRKEIDNKDFEFDDDFGDNNLTKAKYDIVARFNAQYTQIAKLLNRDLPSKTMSNFRHNGSTYSSYDKPSYLSKISKKLANVDKIDKLLNDEYLKYRWFSVDGTVNGLRLPYLKQHYKEIKSGADGIYKWFLSLDTNGIGLSKMDNVTLLKSFITAYSSEANKAYYPLPVLSDSGNMIYMQGYKYNYQDCLSYLSDVALQELDRIYLVNSLSKNSVEIDNFCEYDGKTKSWKGNSTIFNFFPSLNNVEFQNIVKKANGDVNAIRKGARQLIEKAILNEFNDFINQYGIQVDENGKVKNLSGIETINDLRTFYINSILSNIEFTEILSSDPAFYKNKNGSYLGDFQKRWKQVMGRTLKLDTSRMENQTGNMNVIFLEDEEAASEVKSAIDTLLDNMVKKGNMSKPVADIYKKAWSNITRTDGQAFYTLRGIRDLFLGIGTPRTDKIFTILDNLEKGNFSVEDLSLYVNVIKPFCYTQVPVTLNRIIGQDADGKVITEEVLVKTPLQMKDSEFPLLPFDVIANALGKSEKLKGIEQACKDKDGNYFVDRIVFHSAVKVGYHGGIDINGMTDSNEITQHISQQLANPSTQTLHQINYEDWGVQVKTDRLHDVVNQGSQLSKHIPSKIIDNADYTIGNKTFKGSEVRELYNIASAKTPIEGLHEVYEKLNDITKYTSKRLDSMKKSGNYTVYDINAARLNDEGKPVLSDMDPTVMQKRLSLDAAYIRKNTIARNFKGKTLIQVSDFGYSEQLQTVFKNKKGEEISRDAYLKSHKGSTVLDYYKWAAKEYKKGNLSLAYMECFAPVPDARMLPYVSDGKGGIKMNDYIPENLREFIAYRIPTEGYSSATVCRLKDFTSPVYGDVIMLPIDFMIISGCDFDIDKVFTMQPEFNLSNEEKLFSQYNKVVEDIQNANKEVLNSEEGELQEVFTFSQWLDSLKEKPNLKKLDIINDKDDFESVKSKLLKTKNKRLINNLIYDIFKGAIQNENSLQYTVRVSQFETLKRLHTISDLVQNKLLTTKSIKKLNSYNPKLSMYENIENITKEELDALSKSKKTSLPVGTLTQINSIRQNMQGKELVGITANMSALYAMFKNSGVPLDFTVTIDKQKKLDKFAPEKDRMGNEVSENIKETQASAVDNGKFPLMGDMNINTFSVAALTSFLTMGMTLQDTVLLFAHPTITNIINAQARVVATTSNPYPSFHKVFKEAGWKKTKDNAGTEYKDLLDYNDDISINTEELLDDETSRDRTHDIKMAALFAKALNNGKLLQNLTASTKTDVEANSLPHDLGSILNKLISIDNFKDSESLLANLIGKDLSDMSYEQISSILNDPDYASVLYNLIENKSNYFTTYATAFRELGVILPAKTLINRNNITRELLDVTKEIRNILGHGGVNLCNAIAKHYIMYKMSSIPFFNPTDRNIEDEIDVYIKQFPNKFKEFVQKYPEKVRNNFLLNNLVIRNNAYSKKTAPLLTYRRVGLAEEDDIALAKKGWEELLTSNDPQLKALGIHLLKYNFYKTGNFYTTQGLSNLIPLQALLSIPEYREAFDKPDSYYNINRFVEQFLANCDINILGIDNVKSIVFDAAQGRIVDKKASKIDSTTHVIVHKNTVYVDFMDDHNYMYPINRLSNGRDYYVYDINREAEEIRPVYAVTTSIENPYASRTAFEDTYEFIDKYGSEDVQFENHTVQNIFFRERDTIEKNICKRG